MIQASGNYMLMQNKGTMRVGIDGSLLRKRGRRGSSSALSSLVFIVAPSPFFLDALGFLMYLYSYTYHCIEVAFDTEIESLNGLDF